MLQVPGAVHTLHTHSMAAHRQRTGAYNTPVATQWLGQQFMLQFGTDYWLWLFDRHSLETLLKAYQVGLLAHIRLVNLHRTTLNLHWFQVACCWEPTAGLGSALDRPPNQQKV